ncbi:MAG TPA: lipopolysaccharide biosynthesis protein [Anaerolineae bacterium]|nr:lipopolysaccharide biosynthesis protein [Anaerolineae bacterium]
MPDGSSPARPAETPDAGPPDGYAGIVHQAAGSVKWATLANLLPRFFTPVSSLVLAALLTPADFGIVAVSTLVVALARIVVGLGLGAAVVQRQESVARAASAAFWISFGLSVGLYGGLWLAAPSLARLYQIPLLASVIRVSALSLVLFALSTIPEALLQKSMQFRKLFWVSALAQITHAVSSLGLALLGLGVWALVLGPLCAAAVRVLLSWSAARWFPSWSIDRAVLRSLLGFSVWVTVAGFQSWLFLYADNALAGYYLGERGVGVYSLGFSLSQLLPGLIIPALAAVAYPTFSALQNDRRAVGEGLLRLQSVAAVVLFPACFGLSAVAQAGTSLLYGEKWAGLGLVMQFMAIMPGLAHLWSLNAEAYRALGRPDVWPKLAAASLLILLPLLVWAGPHGLVPFTVARFGGQLVYPILHVVVAARVLGLPVSRQLRAWTVPLACALPMYVVAALLAWFLAPFEGLAGWLKLAGVVGSGVLLYAFLLWRIDAGLWTRSWLAGRQVLVRSRV